MRNLTCGYLQILLVVICLVLTRVETEEIVTKYRVLASVGLVSGGGGGR